ncbi:iron chelate uptake ABC transporter family permease subunit [Waltera sp.]|uniref:iron chelate uptake ABC transporter family permease subunit n=1 Tax=Waltera sp. TaxID=2815806 RepID=UPI0039A100D4
MILSSRIDQPLSCLRCCLCRLPTCGVAPFFAFATAILGTWVFVWFIQRIRFKDLVMVPLVGIMFGNVIGGITSYLAYKYEMTQALSSWLVGHFSLVLKGRYEIVWLTVPLVILAFLFANHFNIVGLGRDFSQNLGVPYNLVLFSGLTLSAMITAIDYMKI